MLGFITNRKPIQISLLLVTISIYCTKLKHQIRTVRDDNIVIEEEETGFVLISSSIGFFISLVEEDDEDSASNVSVGVVVITAGTLED